LNQISTIIITFNEEKNILNCLKSVEKISDEIIVVDSFSTDSTMNICMNFPKVKFFQRKWEGYSSAKNWGNSQAEYGYILSIDADEMLSSELLDSISIVKSNLNGAYSFNRLTNYCGKWIHHCGWYPDNKIRLFPKTESVWEGEHVHEILNINSFVKKTKLKGDLLHFSYKNLSEHNEKNLRYAKLDALRMKSKNIRPSYLKLYLLPIVKFFIMFVLKRGFLDGKMGFYVCKLSAQAVYLKHLQLREISIYESRI
jgi:glycosyltransferase involved in cell wall biosynthesis